MNREPEMGKWGQNPSEPREPFLPDEMFELRSGEEAPNFLGLHMPKKPLAKEGVKEFLIELKPLVKEIQQLSRKDQHKIGSYLQEIKNQIHFGDFSEELVRAFEKVVIHFATLLIHSAPIDQKAVLRDIENVESML